MHWARWRRLTRPETTDRRKTLLAGSRSVGLMSDGPSSSHDRYVLMYVIIDGDNLLHAARGEVRAAERANRAWLCRMLACWAVRTGEEVTIVFDGVRPGHPGDGPVRANPLVIRYSGDQTADDIIIEVLESSSSPRRLTVVSSDRKIRQASRRCRAESLDSTTFITSVRSDLKRCNRGHEGEPREKFDGLDPKDRDYWLEQFGLGDMSEG